MQWQRGMFSYYYMVCVSWKFPERDWMQQNKEWRDHNSTRTLSSKTHRYPKRVTLLTIPLGLNLLHQSRFFQNFRYQWPLWTFLDMVSSGKQIDLYWMESLWHAFVRPAYLRSSTSQMEIRHQGPYNTKEQGSLNENLAILTASQPQRP